jgi:hypothetical protein
VIVLVGGSNDGLNARDPRLEAGEALQGHHDGGARRSAGAADGADVPRADGGLGGHDQAMQHLLRVSERVNQPIGCNFPTAGGSRTAFIAPRSWSQHEEEAPTEESTHD